MFLTAPRHLTVDNVAVLLTFALMSMTSTVVYEPSVFQWVRRWVTHRHSTPLTIGVDLLLMQPGGANGGVKPLVFSFLREILLRHGHRYRFVYFCVPELVPEITPILRQADTICLNSEQLPRFDVLYAVFGRSSLATPGIPLVSLIVDLLHRDLPNALPVEEVNYRHDWFTDIAARATFFQCISHYTAARLQQHYSVSPERCFVTHIPVHGRLPLNALTNAAQSPIPSPFFFYPANFWPHKNHEVLLAAYRSYATATGAEAWPLVFTGHPDPRMFALRQQVAQWSLATQVHFLGHLNEAEFSALWAAAGALVYPSLHEGFGIPLLEAMAYQCPIIVSRLTSLPEVGGDACLYVDPHDASSIALALNQIANDPKLRATLARRGTRRLRAFSLDHEAKKLAQHFATAARTATLRP